MSLTRVYTRFLHSSSDILAHDTVIMPQSQNTTGSQTPKSRVLTPELARSRFYKPSSRYPSASSTTADSTTPNQSHPHPHPSSSSSSSSRSRPSISSRFRTTYSSLPYPIRGTFRLLRFLAPAIPIGIFFSEHVFQVVWVRGPSMTPYLNEDYEQMHTNSDMVLVNKWPWGGIGWPWERKRRLERGMVVTFR